jgi:transposase-like protein
LKKYEVVKDWKRCIALLVRQNYGFRQAAILVCKSLTPHGKSVENQEFH